MTGDTPNHPPSAASVRLRSTQRSLPIQLLRAREAVMERFRATLRLYAITEQQWRLLRTLAASDGMEVSDLARASFLLAPSVSRILRDLEARGLLRRERVARDHRRARVSITPEGLRLIDTVAPQSEAIHEEITAAFGPERLARLDALLGELADTMNALPPVTADAENAARYGRNAAPRGRPPKARRADRSGR